MTRKGLLTALLSVAFVAVAVLLVGAYSRHIKESDKTEICRSHLKLILLASRDYAREHGTGYQTNVICLSNELISPVKLLCVNDDAGYRRVREKEKSPFEGQGSAGHWARLTMNDISYQALLKDSNTLVVRCPIHKIRAIAAINGDA